ncbi:TonB-dependent receptor [Viridibacterium curvum]|uniref:TonB-dependent receptor n=1 Tax=Viridibacterium curvum TaxID=1101404 RepID=A0ABP9R0J5_9RHOO
MLNRTVLAATLSALSLVSLPVLADDASDLKKLRAEVDALRKAYESRVGELESRLKQAETKQAATPAATAAATPAAAPASADKAARQSGDTAFNPAVSLILSGTYANLQKDPEGYRIKGFVPGGEIGPGSRGFSLGESELGLSANVDRLFYGQANIALSSENEVGVEEAFIQTTSLPAGLKLKAGRYFSGIGYLNEQHAHTWDFVDAPLAYQAFLGGQFGQDGVQLKWLAPSNTFIELGAEAGRGSNFPGSDRSRNSSGAQSLFGHVGGDIGASHSWRAGLAWLRANPSAREHSDIDLAGSEVTNTFSGSSRLWVADFIWKWAPNGDARRTSFKLQGEYFRRKEVGELVYDKDGTASADRYRSQQSGAYAQAVWQFLPAWRTGYRYDWLDSGKVDYTGNSSNLANPDYKPRKHSVMVDWSPSEFSRVRLQFANDRSRENQPDRQVFLQYQMSLGAHGAHGF